MTATRTSRNTSSASERDVALERAFAQRQSSAYETAYRRFGARLYATALRILRDTSQAQDCVHDVLLHLWLRGNAYTPLRGSLEAFLVTCIRNDALARIRNDTRRRELQRILPRTEPEEMEIDPIERERIARAIATLTPIQAQMVRLAYYRGFTHAEIAHDLDEPLGTIKSRISSALRALRQRLGTDVYDDE